MADRKGPKEIRARIANAKPAAKHFSESSPNPQDVEIEMTMTSPGCPSHVGISEDVRQKVQALPGVKSVNVNVVWTPPWGPERLSPAARQKLGIE